jgi:hypothetical protein
MDYNQPYGKPPEVVYGDTPYINGNPSTGTPGSIPPAASIEYPQRELVNFFKDNSLTPTNTDLHQLSKGVQAGFMHYAIDAGTKNNLQCVMQPAPDKYYDGMFVFVIPAITNDGPSTVNFNGLGVKNIVRRGGGALVAGDLPANYKSLLLYSAVHSNFELYGINFGGTGGFLPILSANTTWYVNGTTGDDTLYDGTSPTISGPHGPFKTIMKAVNTVYTYGPSAYVATIQVAAGTYPEAVIIPTQVGPTTVINGAGKTSTFVTGQNNKHTFNVGEGNRLSVTNLCASTGTGAGPPCCFITSPGGQLNTQDTASGFCAFDVFEAYGGFVAWNNHTFNAGSQMSAAFGSYFGGFMGCGQGAVITFLGTCTCSSAFMIASSNGSIEMPVPGQPVFVNPGYVNGTKWIATVNGVINTQGLGVGFFPGNVAGYQNIGGQYV